jgi:hypothetical protein
LQQLNEAIVTIARETGWNLEYIRNLPIDYLQTLFSEVSFQKSLEMYQSSYNTAMVICALINSDDRHYSPEEIIGERPERRVMEEIKLAQSPKITSIVLADGKEYNLSPLTANMIADLEDRFDKSTSELFSGSVRMRAVIALYFTRLKSNYPELTEQKLGDLITDDVLIETRKKLGV